jgi:hypothetical protein
VCLEVGYVTNPEDAARLADPAFRDVVAGKRRAPRPTSPTVPRASGPLRRISRPRGSRNAAH